MISYQFPSPHTVVVVPILQIERGYKLLLINWNALAIACFKLVQVRKLFLVGVSGAKSIAPVLSIAYATVLVGVSGASY